jgi:hypothetical protein
MIGKHHLWRVETQEGLTFRVEGTPELTRRGNTLIWWCKCMIFISDKARDFQKKARSLSTRGQVLLALRAKG